MDVVSTRVFGASQERVVSIFMLGMNAGAASSGEGWPQGGRRRKKKLCVGMKHDRISRSRALGHWLCHLCTIAQVVEVKVKVRVRGHEYAKPSLQAETSGPRVLIPYIFIYPQAVCKRLPLVSSPCYLRHS